MPTKEEILTEPDAQGFRGWAWALVIVGTPAVVLVFILEGDGLRALMGLTQCGFAALYLKRRASWSAAAIASGVWIAYAVVKTVSLRDIGIETIAAHLGGLAGTLFVSGLALRCFYSTVFDKRERPEDHRSVEDAGSARD